MAQLSAGQEDVRLAAARALEGLVRECCHCAAGPSSELETAIAVLEGALGTANTEAWILVLSGASLSEPCLSLACCRKGDCGLRAVHSSSWWRQSAVSTSFVVLQPEAWYTAHAMDSVESNFPIAPLGCLYVRTSWSFCVVKKNMTLRELWYQAKSTQGGLKTVLQQQLAIC